MGFNIVSTTMDRHKANMKMLKKLLCKGKLENWIENPYAAGKKIFLLFDSTHLLKCISHNFRAKEAFVCPPINPNSDDSANMYPNFVYIRRLQDIEMGKPLKIVVINDLKFSEVRPVEIYDVNFSAFFLHVHC